MTVTYQLPPKTTHLSMSSFSRSFSISATRSQVVFSLRSAVLPKMS